MGRFHDLGPITEPHQHAFEPSVARHRQAGRDPALVVGLTDVVDRVGLDHPPRRRRQTNRHAWHPAVEEPAPRLRQRFVGRLAELTGRLERLDAVDPERAQRLGAMVGGGDVPVAAVGVHLARGDHTFRRVVAGRAPVRDAQPFEPARRIGDLVGGRGSFEVDVEPLAEPGIDTCVAAERGGEFGEAASERTRRVGPGQLHRGAAGGEQLERLGRVEAQRPGEQPRHADEHRALVDEHVDQLVDERRQSAHRHQLEVGRDLVLGQPEALGDLGKRHLAALHQPRQHHQQAPQPLLGTASGARHQPAT